MMTELKLPGWPELPFLLLFVLIVTLVFCLFVVTAEEDGTDGQSGLKAAPAGSIESRVIAPNRSAGE